MGCLRQVTVACVRRDPVCCRSSVVEHSLGKGEVESSILSGSTISFQATSPEHLTLNGLVHLLRAAARICDLQPRDHNKCCKSE